MKLALLIFASAVYIATAVPAPSALPRFIEVPGDEEMVTVDLEAEPNAELLEDIARNPRNSYRLFTRRNPTAFQTLVIDDAASILNSNFDPRLTTVAIAHGYTQSGSSNINIQIRDAYLNSIDANIIVLDWSRISQLDYYTALTAIPSVGQGLGQLIAQINALTGAPLSSFHIVGFSLGAHVAGNAGRTLNGLAGRVTGLDPYTPVMAISRNRLMPTDGIYVEAIHTSGNEGSRFFGDVDFFVNGGDDQPGCLLSLCSHTRSWQLFAATVTFNHLQGNQCASTAEIRADTCTGALLPLGNSDINKRATGMYRVNTIATYPY